MASTDGESLELEVKHKDDGSWHPCRVSLSSSDFKFGLIIDFENSNEEDVISSRQDALERLRFRSTPLQHGECSHIKEGDSVLAMHKDKLKSVFFDAVIEKLHRVKHSNRVFCRCTFEIKWLDAALKGETTTVPSKSIMRLSGEDMDSHPIFSSFLNALGPKGGEAPSSFSLLEEANSEANSEVDLLEGILERQIEEISKSAYGQIDSSADILEVKKPKLRGGRQSKATLVSPVTSNCNQNSSRRSTRSQSKEQNEGAPKKKLEEDKPFLTPLAARAAFASLIHGHELPVKQKITFFHVDKEGQEHLAQKDTKSHSLNITPDRVRCATHSHDIIPDLSSSIQDGDNDNHVESRSTSRRSNQKDWLHVDRPLQSADESEDDKQSAIVNKSSGSTTVGKLSAMTKVTRSSAKKAVEVLSDEVTERSSVVSTRKTRSSVHKEIEASLDEAKQVSSVNKLSSSMNTTTRLTRSRNPNEWSSPGFDHESINIHDVEDTNGMSKESESKQGSSPIVINNLIDSATVGNPSGRSITTRLTRSSVHKEREASPDEVKQGFSIKKIASPTARVTRSRNQTVESDVGIGGIQLAPDTEGLPDDANPSQSKIISPTARVTRSRNQTVESNAGLEETDLTQGAHRSSEDARPSQSKITSPAARVTRSRNQTVQSTAGAGEADLAQDMHGSSEDAKPSQSKITSPAARVTRSRNQTVESNAGRGETDLAQETHGLSEDAKPSQSKNKKRSISSPVDPNTELTNGVSKRTRVSDVATVITEDSGVNLEDSENATGEVKKSERKKSTSSLNLPSRSSPRLNIPTRTHAQKT